MQFIEGLNGELTQSLAATGTIIIAIIDTMKRSFTSFQLKLTFIDFFFYED